MRTRDGQVAAVEKIWTRTHCSIQYKGHPYWVLAEVDDLDPITEDEYRRG